MNVVAQIAIQFRAIMGVMGIGGANVLSGYDQILRLMAGHTGAFVDISGWVDFRVAVTTGNTT